LFLAALAAGLGLDRLLASGLLEVAPTAWRWGAAGVLLALAGVLGVAGIVGFRRVHTPVEPWHPTRALVTSGVYAHVRNPMYLGLVLILVAIALAAASEGTVLATLAVAPVLHYGVVRREERYLARLFGSAYARYRARVPRWGLSISRRRRGD
jgi:protein-S-isoprenylcysteine O-methyltransferase Ste14